MRMQVVLASIAAIALGACDGGSSVEVTVDPETVLDNGMTARQSANARQLNFKDLGGAYKTINDILKLAEPDLNAIQLAAKDVKYAADELLYWFAKGSGPETGLDMEAKVNIWREWETFTEHSKNFRVAATELFTIAQASDLKAIEGQTNVVGRQCKACHDRYREKD